MTTLPIKPKRACRVGVLFNMDIEFHRSYADTIRRVIGRDFHFNITYINIPEFSQEAVRRKVLDSINSPDPYDLFIPIGLRFSAFLKQVYREVGRGRAIFVAVRDPLSYELVDSLQSPGEGVTAVIAEAPSNTAVAEKLDIVGKYISRVLIPFAVFGDKDPTRTQVEEIVQFFKVRGVLAEPVPLSTIDRRIVRAEFEEFFENNLNKHDVVLILEGSFPGLYAEISYFCFERDAILCGDTPSYIHSGAAFAFGGELEPAVAALRETLSSYWLDSIPLGDIPVKVIPNERIFFVNTAMLRLVGFSEEAIQLFKRGDGILPIKMWIDNPLGRGI